MKVLVVDDSNTMRRIIINILTQMEITDVVQAADGVEAVDAVKKGDIDLVLMDWNMPNMSGIDALRAIRSEGHKMPVVMVTTEAEKERIIEALKSGATNYIVKPFNQDVVITKINEVLKR